MPIKTSVLTFCFNVNGDLLFKVDEALPYKCLHVQSQHENTRKRCKKYSNLTRETQEPREWRRFGVIIFIFEHISYFFLMFLLLTLNK